MIGNPLLDKAEGLAKNKYSDSMYDEIHQVFADESVSDTQRNNAKACLKKDLAMYSNMSIILAIFMMALSFLSPGVFDTTEAAVVAIIVLIAAYALLYIFKFKPEIERANYVLSILEDIHK